MAGRLVMVRHGEPAAGLRGVYGCHSGCEGLTPRGEAQARALNERLRATGELGESPVVYTSRLRRAITTAEIALAGAGIAGEWREECGICELHGGDADGLSVAEREARFGPLFSVVREPDRHVAPSGECWNELMVRAGAALRAIVDRHPDGATVAFTHAGVFAAAFYAFTGVAVAGETGGAPITGPPGFATLTTWEWHDPAHPVLVSYGETGHLRADLRDDPVLR